MKRYIIAFLALTFLTGCGQKDKDTVEQPSKFVVTQSVAKDDVVTGYDYIGVVKAKDTKNYSFLMAGKIQEICVEKGQSFKKGDVLAKLDATTLKYSSDINSNSTNQAQAGMEKAADTYDTNISNTEKNIATLQTGIDAGQQGIDAAQGRIATGQKEIEAGEKGIAALETALIAAQTNLDAGQEALNTLKNQLDAAREINKAGGLADLDLEALETQYTQKLAEYDASKAKYDGSKAELEQKRAALESSRAELKQNQAAIEKSKAELATLKTQKITAEKTLQNLKVSKEKDLKSAKATVDSAKTNESITRKNINDTVINATADGYVMELPFKTGEVVAAGYPVVVAKSKELVVTIGVSDKEYPNINLGQKAVINGEIIGKVETIAQYPNEDTRTYAVDILIPEGKLTIGETVNAKVVTGTDIGCYVPINSVFNMDGVDYVYVVNENNKVHRKQIIKGDILGDKVQIKIDDPTAVVVTEGIKSLRENDTVTLEGRKDEK